MLTLKQFNHLSGVTLLRDDWIKKNIAQFFIQSEEKPKSIVTYPMLRVFLSFDWLE